MNSDRTLIVVPTYNERENVARLVARLLEVAPEADVCLLDDDSPDGTADCARELFGRDPRFSVHSRKGLPRGYGRSLVDGYRRCLELGYARLVQLDADFSHDPSMIPALVEASASADVVIGSRYCEGGAVANWPMRRRLLSRFANSYVCRITGLRGARDTTSGFRCYTRRALRQLLEGRIAGEGYAFLVEAVYHAHREGLPIAEVPITFTDRREGESKMSRGVIFESVLMPWRLRFAKHKDEGGRVKDEGKTVKL